MGGRCWDWWNRVPEGVEATNAFFRSQSQEHSLQRISYCWKEWGSSAAAFHEDHTELMNCISVCYHIITYHYIIIYIYINHYHDVLYRFSAESYLWLICRWFMFLQHSSVSIGLAMWHPDVDFPASGLRRRVQTCRRPHLRKIQWCKKNNMNLVVQVPASVGHIFLKVKLMPLCGECQWEAPFLFKNKRQVSGMVHPKNHCIPTKWCSSRGFDFLPLDSWLRELILQDYPSSHRTRFYV